MFVKWLEYNLLFVGLGGWGVTGMARHIHYLLGNDVFPGNVTRIYLITRRPLLYGAAIFEKPLALYAGLYGLPHGYTGITRHN
jgi:hypothetical protein